MSTETVEVRLTWQPVYREWVPKCSCGWVGSYTSDKEQARHEVDRHLIEEHE